MLQYLTIVVSEGADLKDRSASANGAPLGNDSKLSETGEAEAFDSFRDDGKQDGTNSYSASNQSVLLWVP